MTELTWAMASAAYTAGAIWAMIVEIVDGHGFKGAADYVSHDKPTDDDPRPATSERVAWTSTRNLPVTEDDLAGGARIMASTVRDAPALKRLAGVSARGRKCTQPLKHLVLSWPPGYDPTQAEQEDAVDSLLGTLGLQDRQVLVAAHSDRDHSHVHAIVNRISAVDGRAASASSERLIASAWAEQYEREHGGIVCPQRIENRQQRDAGRAPQAPAPGRCRRDRNGRPVEPAPGETEVWAELYAALRANKVPRKEAKQARVRLSRCLTAVRADALRAADMPPPPPVPLYRLEDLDRHIAQLERGGLAERFAARVTAAIDWVASATASPAARPAPATTPPQEAREQDRSRPEAEPAGRAPAAASTPAPASRMPAPEYVVQRDIEPKPEQDRDRERER